MCAELTEFRFVVIGGHLWYKWPFNPDNIDKTFILQQSYITWELLMTVPDHHVSSPQTKPQIMEENISTKTQALWPISHFQIFKNMSCTLYRTYVKLFLILEIFFWFFSLILFLVRGRWRVFVSADHRLIETMILFDPWYWSNLWLVLAWSENRRKYFVTDQNIFQN